MFELSDGVGVIRGQTRLCLVPDPEKWWLSTELLCKSNQIQYAWGFVAAMCAGFGNSSYRLNSIYVEYENVVSPSDVVSVPTFDKAEGLSYYSDLGLTSNRDYLRIPLVQQPMLGVDAGYESFFPAGQGNKLTFWAITQGTVGVHGRPFVASSNSKVCGVALVAAPVFGDRTQDVIFARTYYQTSQQVIKPPSAQIGIGWDIIFGEDL